MEEITTTKTRWDKLTGTYLGDTENVPTAFGDKTQINVRCKNGEIKSLFKTATMQGLTPELIGCMIALVREPLPDGKSHIRVYVDRTKKENVQTSPDYDPFSDDETI